MSLDNEHTVLQIICFYFSRLIVGVLSSIISPSHLLRLIKCTKLNDHHDKIIFDLIY